MVLRCNVVVSQCRTTSESRLECEILLIGYKYLHVAMFVFARRFAPKTQTEILCAERIPENEAVACGQILAGFLQRHSQGGFLLRIGIRRRFSARGNPYEESSQIQII